MIVQGERVARWLSEKMGKAFCPPYHAVGLERDGEIVNAILLTGFEGNNVWISAAGTGWLRGELAAFGDYVFGQLGCLRATFVTEQPAVIRLAERLGGKREGVMRDHFGKGRDGHIIGLLCYEYKFGNMPAIPRH